MTGIALLVCPLFGQQSAKPEQQAREKAAQAALEKAQRAAEDMNEALPGEMRFKLEQAKAAALLDSDKMRAAAAMAAQAAREVDAELNLDLPLKLEGALAAASSSLQDVQGKMYLAQAKAATTLAQDRARREAGRGESVYNRGTRSIDRREYERAVEYFDQVIETRGDRADGALYWKAYAQNKMGRRDQALATLAQLQKQYPQSRWLNDAKALEVEVRQAAGRPVSPEAESDEDLKLLALNSLMQSDPERSVPILEKLLQDPKAAPKLKERALFVLAQSRDPRARTTLGQIAKGGSNPDLQMKAVEYLGVFGRGNGDLLNEVYRSTNDPGVRRAVIRGYMQSGDKERLASLFKSEQNPELRREVIRMLGVTHAQAELQSAYQSESDAGVRREILRAMMIAGDADRLLAAAKTEKDPRLRVEAIQLLGTMSRDKTGPALASMYASETDASAKEAILNALFIQGNAKTLVDLARKETDPKLKKTLVERLSVMRSKEAADYLMEVLNK
jgi:tetratricopeptide (TPR) repeat protein